MNERDNQMNKQLTTENLKEGGGDQTQKAVWIKK